MNPKINNNIVSTVENALKKGLMPIFFASALSNILGFISSTLIVRFVSKIDYGVYSYANNQLGFFLLATGLGADSAILQMCSENFGNDSKVRSIYHYGCSIAISVNVILAVLILVYSFIVPFPIKNADVILRSMCLLPLVTLLPSLQTTFLRSNLRNNDFAISNIIRAIISCVLLISGAYFFKVNGLIAGTYMRSLLTTAIIAIFFHVPVINKGRCCLSHEIKKDFFKIAFISMINNAISSLLYLLDIYIIAAVNGNEEIIAAYKVATVIPTGLLFIPKALITFIYPYFAQHKDDVAWTKKNFIRAILGSFAMDASIAVILFLVAPWLLPFIFRSNYADAVLPFRILIIGFAFSGSFRVLSGNLLVTQRELKFNTFVAAISGIINIIADIILVQIYGSMGAAIATVIVQLISGIMNTSRMFYILNKKKKLIKQKRNEEG